MKPPLGLMIALIILGFLLAVVIPIMIRRYLRRPEYERRWTDPKESKTTAGLRNPNER